MAALSCPNFARSIVNSPSQWLLVERTVLVQGSKHSGHGANAALGPGTNLAVSTSEEWNPRGGDFGEELSSPPTNVKGLARFFASMENSPPPGQVGLRCESYR